MFTGIIQAKGIVSEVNPTPAGCRLIVDPGDWAHTPGVGDSIAVQGCCLTVATPPDPILSFDVVPETLSKTVLGRFEPGRPVHLEHAVTPSTLLGGHLLQGHVDAVAEVIQVDQGEEYRIRITPPRETMRFLSTKGSVGVDGVSLTVAALTDAWFEVALIPTTLDVTTLGDLKVGDFVNLETDMINKMVVHWLETRDAGR